MSREGPTIGFIPLVPTDQLIKDVAAADPRTEGGYHQIRTAIAELERRGVSNVEASRLTSAFAFIAEHGRVPRPVSRATVPQVSSWRRAFPGAKKTLPLAPVVRLTSGPVMLLVSGLAAALMAFIVVRGPLSTTLGKAPAESTPKSTVPEQPQTGSEWRLQPAPVTATEVRRPSVLMVRKEQSPETVAATRAPTEYVLGPLPAADQGDLGREPMRLESGHEWSAPETPDGQGELTVRNGNSEDAVAVLVKRNDGGERPSRAVYVRGGEQAKLAGIGEGSYDLRFMLGVDWDEDSRSFRHNSRYQAIASPLGFREYDTRGQGSVIHHWATHSVTLHHVVGGNVTARTVDPALLRFDALTRQP